MGSHKNILSGLILGLLLGSVIAHSSGRDPLEVGDECAFGSLAEEERRNFQLADVEAARLFKELKKAQKTGNSSSQIVIKNKIFVLMVPHLERIIDNAIAKNKFQSGPVRHFIRIPGLETSEVLSEAFTFLAEKAFNPATPEHQFRQYDGGASLNTWLTGVVGTAFNRLHSKAGLGIHTVKDEVPISAISARHKESEQSFGSVLDKLAFDGERDFGDVKGARVVDEASREHIQVEPEFGSKLPTPVRQYIEHGPALPLKAADFGVSKQERERMTKQEKYLKAVYTKRVPKEAVARNSKEHIGRILARYPRILEDLNPELRDYAQRYFLEGSKEGETIESIDQKTNQIKNILRTRGFVGRGKASPGGSQSLAHEVRYRNHSSSKLEAQRLKYVQAVINSIPEKDRAFYQAYLIDQKPITDFVDFKRGKDGWRQLNGKMRTFTVHLRNFQEQQSGETPLRPPRSRVGSLHYDTSPESANPRVVDDPGKVVLPKDVRAMAAKRDRHQKQVLDNPIENGEAKRRRAQAEYLALIHATEIPEGVIEPNSFAHWGRLFLRFPRLLDDMAPRQRDVAEIFFIGGYRDRHDPNVVRSARVLLKRQLVNAGFVPGKDGTYKKSFFPQLRYRNEINSHLDTGMVEIAEKAIAMMPEKDQAWLRAYYLEQMPLSELSKTFFDGKEKRTINLMVSNRQDALNGHVRELLKGRNPPYYAFRNILKRAPRGIVNESDLPAPADVAPDRRRGPHSKHEVRRILRQYPGIIDDFPRWQRVFVREYYLNEMPEQVSHSHTVKGTNQTIDILARYGLVQARKNGRRGTEGPFLRLRFRDPLAPNTSRVAELKTLMKKLSSEDRKLAKRFIIDQEPLKNLAETNGALLSLWSKLRRINNQLMELRGEETN